MELKDQLAALKNDIESRIEKANNQAIETGKIASDLKTELTNATAEWAKKNDLTQGQLDSMATDMKKLREGLVDRAQVKSFAERLAEDGGFKAWREKSAKSSGNIEFKAVGDMSSSASLTNGSNVPFIEPTRLNSIVPVKREPVNIRSLFSVIPMTGNIFSFPQETGGEGAPTTVAEAGAKPQSDNDFAQKEAPARKIAHYKKMSEELVNDVPAMAGFLQTYGVVELLKVEDAQLLSGGGTAPNITGLSVNALSDANFAGSVFANTFATGATVTNFDALTATIGLLAANKHTPDVIVMNPADWYHTIIKAKGTDYHYNFPAITADAGPLMWNGVRIVLTTSVAQGTFYCGDTNAAQIAQREGISVRFYDQNEDDAIKNMVTVVIEERLAFPIYYPTAWYVDTFANTIAAIQA